MSEVAAKPDTGKPAADTNAAAVATNGSVEPPLINISKGKTNSS